jgi:NAD(P)-dependent dehydrogenase (short-subunit alcohol dehydrogenase family)
LGNMAAFLASDLASYINGVNIPIDGGFLSTL